MATEEQLEFLDRLRERGTTNMYGAAPYVERQYGVTKTESKEIVKEWMSTFEERHPDGA